MKGLYTLRGHEPVPCDDITEWGLWFATANRHVAQTMVGKVRVSTVFLGLDHSWSGGEPLLFETMCFGDENDFGSDFAMDRYATWDEAEAGHAATVAAVERFQQAKPAKRIGGAAA